MYEACVSQTVQLLPPQTQFYETLANISRFPQNWNRMRVYLDSFKSLSPLIGVLRPFACKKVQHAAALIPSSRLCPFADSTSTRTCMNNPKSRNITQFRPHNITTEIVQCYLENIAISRLIQILAKFIVLELN